MTHHQVLMFVFNVAWHVFWITVSILFLFWLRAITKDRQWW